MSSVSNALFDEFQKWTSIYNRVFANSELRDKSFSAWQQNFQHVEYINSLNLSWTASIYTPYADMTTEEFKNKILLRPFDVTVSYPQFSEVKVSPTSRYGNLNNDGFDWRDYGAVTPVQDQGTVGTCWAFSTIGNIEGVWFLNNHTLTKLSEEYIVDCDGTHDESHADCGVFGGWPYLAYDFVIKSGGVPTEDAYPYCSGTGDCYPCMQGPISLCGPPPLYCDKTIEQNKCPTQYQDLSNGKITSWDAISTDETEIQSQLISRGPLSALLDATQLQFYSSGVWTGYLTNPKLGCSKTYLDHAVLIVGYGTDVDLGMDYWIVKNSWGQNFGEDGYFRILRGEGTCGINTAVTSAVV